MARAERPRGADEELMRLKVKCGDPHWVPIWGGDSEEASEGWTGWTPPAPVETRE